jgi:hypothetical protein
LARSARPDKEAALGSAEARQRHRQPSVPLPAAVGIAQALDASRVALCALLVLRPEPLDLKDWLAGPYYQAARFAGKLSSIGGCQGDPSDIVDAQKRTARIIEVAGRGGDALVKLLPAVVHIRPAHDRFGGRGFVPLDVRGAPLFDRALSLALADYFTRPDDFLAHDYPTSAAALRRLSRELCTAAAPVDDNAVVAESGDGTSGRGRATSRPGPGSHG